MASNRESREDFSAIADGAIDTLGSLFHTLGAESFPLDTDPDPGLFADRCSDIAKHIEHGAAVPEIGIRETVAGREWRAVRGFFASRRREEKSFVMSRLGQYRGIVEDFMVGLKHICGHGKDTERQVQECLSAIDSAVAGGNMDAIKSVISTAVHKVDQAFEAQKREYEQQISALNERVNILREDLVSVQDEMQLDPLTKVYNRRAFDMAIQRYVNTQFILGQAVSVIMVDVDTFKTINDTRGHAAGDAVLQAVAECLSRCFMRKNDTVARYGGDEFVIILPDTDLAGATASVQRMLEAVRRLEIDAGDGREAAVTCSAGCTEMQPDDTVESLLVRADQALYMAKKAGRDCFRAE